MLELTKRQSCPRQRADRRAAHKSSSHTVSSSTAPRKSGLSTWSRCCRPVGVRRGPVRQRLQGTKLARAGGLDRALDLSGERRRGLTRGLTLDALDSATGPLCR